MAVDKLNAFPYIITTAPVEITTGAASFANAEDLANVRTYQGGAAITWQTFDWSNIPAETLADWLTNASQLPASTSLIELTPENFITGSALITESTDGSQASLSVNIDTATSDLFTDYLIYYGTETPSSLTVTHTANLYSAVRSLDPTASDWTTFTAHNDATRLSELQALADAPKALHLWTDAAGTGSAAFDIPDVKTFNHYDHRDNREAMPYLQGNGQDFNGLTTYNTVSSVLGPTKDKEQIFNFSFDLTDYTSGTVYGLLYPKFANLHGLCYAIAIVPDVSGNNNKMIFAMFDNFNTTNEPSNNWGVQDVKLKNGYNNIIIHLKDYTIGTGVDFYINANKASNVTFTQNLGGVPVTASPVTDDYHIGQRIGTAGSSYPFYGNMKVFQWLDVTGQTITAAKIKAIAEQHDARNILDFTNAVLDVDFSTNPVSDRSPNTYGITTFNGLSQSNYL